MFIVALKGQRIEEVGRSIALRQVTYVIHFPCGTADDRPARLVDFQQAAA